MNTAFPEDGAAPAGRVWQVGALVRAIADLLGARLNPVTVRGEISGLSRPASGHWYFTLKDARSDGEPAQLRCAMFRRAAQLVDFVPRDGDLVELRGRLDLYAPRGDLQLIGESMTRAGQGSLFEQFVRLKARLEAEGLFDAGRKRALRPWPRALGIVTSLQAAALHDVVTALRRRAPHVPVYIAPASVQGAQAPHELLAALRTMGRQGEALGIDTVLLVRGGGSIEDLWAFNDENLARAIVACPVPVVSGVGHETDFTIADFCADLRAPTPTAAAELAARPRTEWLQGLDRAQQVLQASVHRQLDHLSQRLDQAAQRLARPSQATWRQRSTLQQSQARLDAALRRALGRAAQAPTRAATLLPRAVAQDLRQRQEQLARLELRLRAIDPGQVLQRGYAWLTGADGAVITRVGQLAAGDEVQARLADGTVRMGVHEVQAGPPGQSSLQSVGSKKA